MKKVIYLQKSRNPKKSFFKRIWKLKKVLKLTFFEWLETIYYLLNDGVLMATSTDDTNTMSEYMDNIYFSLKDNYACEIGIISMYTYIEIPVTKVISVHKSKGLKVFLLN